MCSAAYGLRHIFSGKIILYFVVPESLRTFRDHIFTGGAAKGNGRINPLRHGLRRATSPEGGGLLQLTDR